MRLGVKVKYTRHIFEVLIAKTERIIFDTDL